MFSTLNVIYCKQVALQYACQDMPIIFWAVLFSPQKDTVVSDIIQFSTEHIFFISCTLTVSQNYKTYKYQHHYELVVLLFYFAHTWIFLKSTLHVFVSSTQII